MNFLTIILLIYTTTYGNYNSTYCNSNNRYNGVSTQQTSRIGYTTNYGNSFGSSTSAYISSSKNMRSTVYSNVVFISTSRVVYTPTSSTYGPRKSKERPYSGNWIEDLADWWRMNTDSDWPSYVDDDYWEDFLAEYPEYEDDAREWFEEHGQKFPPDPPEPYLTPVGEVPLGLMLFVSAGWILYRSKKKTREDIS